MAVNDPELGLQVQKHLATIGIETPANGRIPQNAYVEVASAQSTIMRALGLDMKDDSLKETPERVAKMWVREAFFGLDYNQFPKATTVENKMRYKEMIAACDISVMSFCEHHFIPFIGTADVAYIPDNRILGLSKFNRIVNFFARRPQIQERLTEQIVAALQFILQTESVACVIKANHLCVQMRGVRDVNSYTVTSRLGGKFFTQPSLRSEFLALSNGGKHA